MIIIAVQQVIVTSIYNNQSVPATTSEYNNDGFRAQFWICFAVVVEGAVASVLLAFAFPVLELSMGSVHAGQMDNMRDIETPQRLDFEMKK